MSKVNKSSVVAGALVAAMAGAVHAGGDYSRGGDEIDTQINGDVNKIDVSPTLTAEAHAAANSGVELSDNDTYHFGGPEVGVAVDVPVEIDAPTHVEVPVEIEGDGPVIQEQQVEVEGDKTDVDVDVAGDKIVQKQDQGQRTDVSIRDDSKYDGRRGDLGNIPDPEVKAIKDCVPSYAIGAKYSDIFEHSLGFSFSYVPGVGYEMPGGATYRDFLKKTVPQRDSYMEDNNMKPSKVLSCILETIQRSDAKNAHNIEVEKVKAQGQVLVKNAESAGEAYNKVVTHECNLGISEHNIRDSSASTKEDHRCSERGDQLQEFILSSPDW